jgi:hypothetical protein
MRGMEGRHRGRGRRRRGGPWWEAREARPQPSDEEVRGWLAGRLPPEWFEGAPEIHMDRDEILVVGTLPDITLEEGASAEALAAARSGRIRQFREDTREARMRIADETEGRFGKKVAWGAVCGETRELFTTLSVPVMTRLRMAERRVLDTLVEAGVARSRSHALAWCVRLVGENQAEWIERLREAMQGVERVRAEGPGWGEA